MSLWKIRKNSSTPSSWNTEEVIASLMQARGFNPQDQSFRSSSLSSLSSPLALGKGVEDAASILLGCRGKDVVVVGDYDADGIMASVIMKRTVLSLGGRCTVFLPSRWVHGYGLNDKTVSDLVSRFTWHKPDILFTVDCGSSSEDQLSILRSYGIQKIAVIDHHIMSGKALQSADAHVNWRLSDNSTQFCAAGEVMQVCRLALMRAGLPWEWAIPFAAVATVGDVVGISGDNRIIVKNGANYSKMIEAGSPGLSSLVTKQCSGGVSQKSLSFYVVPRINAAGRMSSPDLALEFMLEDDSERAAQLLSHIESANDERKTEQDRILKDGIKMLGKDAKPSFVFLHDPSWNIGVVGITCSQMVERYGVPAMMFGTYGGKVRGSGRSVPGVNIKAILDQCGNEVFEKWGGHELACGATVRGGMFSEARSRFEESVMKAGGGVFPVHIPEYDLDVEPKHITRELGNALFENLYPYCETMNPEPVFRLSGATVKSLMVSNFKKWSKVNLWASKNGDKVPIQMSSFVRNGIDEPLLNIREGDIVDLYFSYPQTIYSDFGFDDDYYSLELIEVVKV